MLKNQIKEMELRYAASDCMLKVAEKELKDTTKVVKEVEQQMAQLIDRE